MIIFHFSKPLFHFEKVISNNKEKTNPFTSTNKQLIIKNI